MTNQSLRNWVTVLLTIKPASYDSSTALKQRSVALILVFLFLPLAVLISSRRRAMSVDSKIASSLMGLKQWNLPPVDWANSRQNNGTTSLVASKETWTENEILSHSLWVQCQQQLVKNNIVIQLSNETFIKHTAWTGRVRPADDWRK